VTLAVFVTQIGAVSETFIRRHVEDLAPGRTVVVTRYSSDALRGRWHAPGSVLQLDRWGSRPTVRIARRLGIAVDGLRMQALARFLRRHGVEAVLGEYLDQFAEFVPLLDRMSIPYAVHGHGIDLSAALREPSTAERYQVYRSARAILTHCEFHRRRLIGLGLPADKVAANPSGIDVPDAPVARAPESAKRFLAIGRFTAKKGPIFLLEAFRIAAAEDSDLTLDYIGHGEMWLAVRQFVAATGLSGRVRLLGTPSYSVRDEYLRTCGIFVQHSITDPDTGDEEGLPVAIQEAMAQAMPVISTRHSGIPEAVDEGATGLLVDEGDVRGMAEAMLRLASDAEACRNLGLQGYSKASRHYRWADERARLLHALGWEQKGL
jgi:colanic acid/amylovoran biosynthesis glycosyltransferase